MEFKQSISVKITPQGCHIDTLDVGDIIIKVNDPSLSYITHITNEIKKLGYITEDSKVYYTGSIPTILSIVYRIASEYVYPILGGIRVVNYADDMYFGGVEKLFVVNNDTAMVFGGAKYYVKNLSKYFEVGKVYTIDDSAIDNITKTKIKCNVKPLYHYTDMSDTYIVEYVFGTTHVYEGAFITLVDGKMTEGYKKHCKIMGILYNNNKQCIAYNSLGVTPYFGTKLDMYTSISTLWEQKIIHSLVELKNYKILNINKHILQDIINHEY